mmetsp:Transcript_930/g.1448  ORF Transcript_930/g.1448 Transcript_930/m.1448 type:complete len:237 (-) Transcript_930:335-1045(-)
MQSNKHLVLFKSDLPEPIFEALRKKFTVTCVPVLSFEFECYQENLRKALQQDVSGVVFPSPRAVEAVKLLGPSSILHKKWFAVGKGTAEVCQNMLGRKPDAVGTKGAQELISEVLPKTGFSGTLLYLCGDNALSLAREEMEKQGYDFMQAVVYHTRSVSSEELFQSLEEVPDVCVFFSPSGVKTVASAFNWDWSTIQVIAIGDTTASALQNTLNKCDGVPEEFNLEGLVKLLTNEV